MNAGRDVKKDDKKYTNLSKSVCKCHDMLNDFKFWSRAHSDSEWHATNE